MYGIGIYKFTRWLCTSALVTSAALSFSFAVAQSDDDRELKNHAITIAQSIEANDLIDKPYSGDILASIDTLEQNERLHKLRKLANDVFINKVDLDTIDFLQKYADVLQTAASPTDLALYEFYSKVFSVYNPNTPLLAMEDVLEVLESYETSDIWVIRHQTLNLKSDIYTNHRLNTLALESATESFETIPETADDFTQYAKIQSYDRMAYLNNILINPNISVPASENLIDELQAADLPVDGIEIINNLIYAFDGWRDYETTEKLSEILLRLEKQHGSKTPGLTQMRAAHSAKNLGKFKDTLELAKEGIKITQIDIIRDNLKILEIEGYAGYGITAIAKKKLAELKYSLKESGSGINFETRTRYARALIAAEEGDGKTALRLMKEESDSAVQNVLRSNNNNTGSLLANLENNKERQREREQAAKREAKLVQGQLEEQVKSTRLFLTIAILFGIMAVMAATTAIYRSRTSKRLAKSAEAALAGEKAKTQFLAVMSHELRTPLNGIVGIADMLTHKAPTPELRSQIGIINDSGNDLLRIVEQILDMSMLDANELEIFPDTTDVRDIISAVDQNWRSTIEKTGVNFTTYVEPTVPDNILIDPRRLQQCVHNLVSNAARFTTTGRVHVHVTARTTDGMLANNNKHNVSSMKTAQNVDVRIIVADTGIGMTADVQETLFKPFIQADNSSKREFGGSGLGLAITSRLTEMMNGQIDVVTREGAGSEFTLRFRCELDHSEAETVVAKLPVLEKVNDSDNNDENTQPETVYTLKPVALQEKLSA